MEESTTRSGPNETVVGDNDNTIQKNELPRELVEQNSFLLLMVVVVVVVVVWSWPTRYSQRTKERTKERTNKEATRNAALHHKMCLPSQRGALSWNSNPWDPIGLIVPPTVNHAHTLFRCQAKQTPRLPLSSLTSSISRCCCCCHRCCCVWMGSAACMRIFLSCFLSTHKERERRKKATTTATTTRHTHT